MTRRDAPWIKVGLTSRATSASAVRDKDTALGWSGLGYVFVLLLLLAVLAFDQGVKSVVVLVGGAAAFKRGHSQRRLLAQQPKRPPCKGGGTSFGSIVSPSFTPIHLVANSSQLFKRLLNQHG